MLQQLAILVYYFMQIAQFISECLVRVILSLILISKIGHQQKKDCQIPCLNGGVLTIRPADNINQVCICNKNYIGARCEIRLDSLRNDEKQKYGCALRPCWIGSTCEDRDGSFVCHCSAVNTFTIHN